MPRQANNQAMPWAIRSRSWSVLPIRRRLSPLLLVNYLSRLESGMHILDVGCGAGDVGEVHAAEQIPETSIRAQTVEVRIGLQKYHPRRPLLIGSFQPMKSLFFLIQRGVDSG